MLFLSDDFFHSPLTHKKSSRQRTALSPPIYGGDHHGPSLTSTPTSSRAQQRSAAPTTRKPFTNVSNVVFQPVKSKLINPTRKLTSNVSNSMGSKLEPHSSSIHLEATPTSRRMIKKSRMPLSLDEDSFTDEDPYDLEDNDSTPTVSNYSNSNNAAFAGKKGTQSFTSMAADHGSPIQQRRTIRRIHSLCQTNKEKEEFFFDDNSFLAQSSVVHYKVQDDLLPRIDVCQMVKLLDGQHLHEFDKIHIIDCRFKYEFDGGHITGAINVNSQEQLHEKFISTMSSPASPNASPLQRTLLVFHCEFSKFRGPALGTYLRKCDRTFNSNNYPRLSYPDIVILDGGYKKFFDTHRELCSPQGYVEMNDFKFQSTCEFEMDKIRQENKLTRAKSLNTLLSTSSSSSSFAPSLNLTFSNTSIASSCSSTLEIPILRRQKSHNKKLRHKTSSCSISKLEAKLSRAASFTESPKLNSASNGLFSNSTFPMDFHPPVPPGSLHRKWNSHSSINASSTSINSSSSSIYSDYLLTDSLTDVSSSIELSSEILDWRNGSTSHNNNNNNNSTINTNHKGSGNSNGNGVHSKSLLRPITRKPSVSVPQLPPCKDFKFPNFGVTNNINNNNSNHHEHSINSTTTSITGFTTMINHDIPTRLTKNTPKSSSGSRLSPIIPQTSPNSVGATPFSSQSFIDPIIDTPVDFSVPTSCSTLVSGAGGKGGPKKHSRMASLLNSSQVMYGFIDIDEVNEDELDDDD